MHPSLGKQGYKLPMVAETILRHLRVLAAAGYSILSRAGLGHSLASRGLGLGHGLVSYREQR